MPPNVASLTDLVSYTADQEERIKRVFVAGEKERKTGRKGTFRDACAAWETFRRSVWGYGLGFFDTEEAGFDRGDDPIDDFSIKSEDPFNPPLDPELPPSQPSFDLVPARRQVMKIPPTLFEASGERSDRILIRSEYGHAERAALLARGSGAQAFLVTGQPGIGKSVFLFRLLIRRLSLELPTVVQLVPNCALLFHSDGVYEFEQLADPGPYVKLNPRSSDPHRNIWALIDSTAIPTQPDGVFMERCPFFIVETASYHSNCLYSTKVVPIRFYLKPWTFPEVAQARTLVEPVGPPEERELWDLYKTYGASCRLLFECVARPERYLSLVRDAVGSVEDLVHALTRPGHITGLSHFLVLLEPSPIDRSLCQAKIITHTVFEMVWRRHLAKKVVRAREFYDLFMEHSYMSAAAGWLFEFQIHQLLRKGRTIAISPIRCTHDHGSHLYGDYRAMTNDKSMGLERLELPPSDEYPLHEGATLEVGRYYRPESATFPTIDSLCLVEPPGRSAPVLLIFRIARDKTSYDVMEKGLHKVQQLKLPNPQTRKYYVAVTPGDLQPKITISGRSLGPMCEGRPEDVFPVYHYPVDLDGLFEVPG